LENFHTKVEHIYSLILTYFLEISKKKITNEENYVEIKKVDHIIQCTLCENFIGAVSHHIFYSCFTKITHLGAKKMAMHVW
jgi:hypothetical protein